MVEYGQNAIEFLLGRNSERARPRGFAADVEDVRTGAFHLKRVLDGAARIEKFAAVGEAVRRDVENAHDERALAEHELA